MKRLLKIIIATSFLVLPMITNAGSTVSKRKLNGPECTSHLMKVLDIKSDEAYQICSSHNEEVKVCLIQNRKLNKKELLKKCNQK